MSWHRVPDARFGESIAEGLRRLPAGMRRRVGHVRFVCGVDPVFAGLHTYRVTTDGRSYRDTAHTLYAAHLLGPRDRRVTTIAMPVVIDPAWVVHELGHVLDEVTGFSHTARPVTGYGATNRREAFAEALVAWTHIYGDRDVARRDGATLALFEELAG